MVNSFKKSRRKDQDYRHGPLPSLRRNFSMSSGRQDFCRFHPERTCIGKSRGKT